MEKERVYILYYCPLSDFRIHVSRNSSRLSSCIYRAYHVDYFDVYRNSDLVDGRFDYIDFCGCSFARESIDYVNNQNADNLVESTPGESTPVMGSPDEIVRREKNSPDKTVRREESIVFSWVCQWESLSRSIMVQ